MNTWILVMYFAVSSELVVGQSHRFSSLAECESAQQIATARYAICASRSVNKAHLLVATLCVRRP